MTASASDAKAAEMLDAPQSESKPLYMKAKKRNNPDTKDAEGQNHKKAKLDSGVKDESVSTENKNLSPREARIQSILRCIQVLVHASQCRDVSCGTSSCRKMKRVLAHTKSCKNKNNGGCSICKQFIALCCYHARNCNIQRCIVIHCIKIKRKLQEQEMQQRFQQLQVMERMCAGG